MHRCPRLKQRSRNDWRTDDRWNFSQSCRGHLQADAYVAYDSFFTDAERGMVEVGCWAHSRRHFRNALESDRTRMSAVLLMIAQLYAVEKSARLAGLLGEDLWLAREHGSRPVWMACINI